VAKKITPNKSSFWSSVNPSFGKLTFWLSVVDFRAIGCLPGRRRYFWTKLLNQANRGSEGVFAGGFEVDLTPPRTGFEEVFLAAVRFWEDEDFFGIKVCFLNNPTVQFHYSAFHVAGRAIRIRLATFLKGFNTTKDGTLARALG